MKRGKKMILLLALLAVMVGAYYGVQQFNKKESVSETAGTFELTAKTAEDLTGLSWTQGESSWSFRYEDETWVTTEEPSWPVDQLVLQELADEILALKGTRKLENITNPADYGLETPGITVTASWNDGTETAYSMGDATPFEDGYYLSLSGEDGIIYTIASSLSDTFDKTQTDMIAMEEIPTVTDVTRLTVGSSLDAVRADESKTVNPDQLWYDAKTEEPLDGDNIETLINSASGLTWKEFVAANADEETLAGWLLDDASAIAVSLTGSDGETLEILFGADNENGDLYARLPGSTMVYTVASNDVSGLLSASVDNLWVSTILPISYENLAFAEFVTEKGSFLIDKKMKSEEADAAESEAEEAEAAKTAEAENGEAETAEETEVEEAEAEGAETDGEASEAEEAQKSLWEQAAALKAEERLAQAGEGDELLSIHAVSADGLETTVVFTSYSADQYQAQTDAGRAFLVPADQVDAVIRTIRTNQ